MKRKQKRAYMVPVQHLIPVTIYYEEVASNAKQASKNVRKYFQHGCISNGNQAEAFMAEAKTELQDHYFYGGKVRVWDGEPASLFHSSKECGVCRKVEAKYQRGKK